MSFWSDIADKLDYQPEPLDGVTFLTLILLEGLLSFDNAAVLAAMVRQLPKHQQRKALLYGLVGAYTFRVSAILLASFLIDSPTLTLIGGLYLLYLAVHHFYRHMRHLQGGDVPPLKGFLGLSAFWSMVIMVELADIVFALDQIVAAVALTDKYPVIIAAALIAILALRLSATYMIRVMDWFPPLEHLAYTAVGWVGLKLIVEVSSVLLDGQVVLGFEIHPAHVPKAVAVTVTLLILAAPVVVKILMDRARRRRTLREPPPPGGPVEASGTPPEAPAPPTEQNH